MGFFDSIANSFRNNPSRLIGTALQLGGAATRGLGQSRQIGAAQQVSALNTAHIRALAPLQIEAINDQIQSVKDVANLDTESADDEIAYVRQSSQRVAREITLRNESVSGGVPIPSNVDIDDIFSDKHLKNAAGEIVKDLGQLGDLRRRRAQLIGERNVQIAAGGVRRAKGHYEDISKDARSRLSQLERELENNKIQMDENQALLNRANLNYLNEIRAIDMQRDAQIRALENQREQTARRSDVAISEGALEQEGLEAQQLANIGGLAASAAQILLGDNPIGNAASSALSGIGGGSGSGLGGGGGSSAPFSSGGSSVVEALNTAGPATWNPALTLIGGASGVVAGGGLGAAAAAAPSVAGGVALNAFANPLAAAGAGAGAGGAGAAGASLAALGPFAAAAAGLAVGGPMIADLFMGAGEPLALRQERGREAAERYITSIRSGGVEDLEDLQRLRPGTSLSDMQSILLTARGSGGGTPGFTGVATDEQTVASIDSLLSEITPLLDTERQMRILEFSNYGGGG